MPTKAEDMMDVANRIAADLGEPKPYRPGATFEDVLHDEWFILYRNGIVYAADSHTVRLKDIVKNNPDFGMQPDGQLAVAHIIRYEAVEPVVF